MEGVYVANYYENTRELEAYDRAMEANMGQDINGGSLLGARVAFLPGIYPSVHRPSCFL